MNAIAVSILRERARPMDRRPDAPAGVEDAIAISISREQVRHVSMRPPRPQAIRARSGIVCIIAESCVRIRVPGRALTPAISGRSPGQAQVQRQGRDQGTDMRPWTRS